MKQSTPVLVNSARPFYVCLLAALLANATVPGLRIGAEVLSQNDESDADKLEQFISHPPILRQIVYENLPLNFAQSVEASTNLVRQLFLVRLQTNGFYFAQLRRSQDVESDIPSSPILAVGRFERTFWYYKYDFGLLVYELPKDQGDFDLDGKKGKNDVLNQCIIARDTVSRVLNAGIPNAGIGRVRWSGDRFDLTNIFGFRWQGVLATNSEGRAEDIFFTSTSFQPRHTLNHIVTYQYSPDTNVPSYFPSEAVYYEIGKDGARKPSHAFKILEMQIADRMLPSEMFLWSLHKLENTNLYAFTNGGIVRFVGGVAKPLLRATEIGELGTARRRTRMIWLFSFVAVVSVIVAVAYQNSKQRRSMV